MTHSNTLLNVLNELQEDFIEIVNNSAMKSLRIDDFNGFQQAKSIKNTKILASFSTTFLCEVGLSSI